MSPETVGSIPGVTVCIPTYNQADYLPLTVDSVLAQTRPPLSVVIGDDASSDRTPAVIAELGATNPNVQAFRQPANRGIAGNSDDVLRRASTEFVMRLDSDDRLLPPALERLAKALAAHPGAGCVHAAVWEIDQAGTRGRLRRLARGMGLMSAEDALRAALRGYRVSANIVMFRRTALVSVGYLTGRPDYVEDYHLSVALARAGWGNVYVDEPLAEYRVWMDVKRVRARRKLIELNGVIRTFDEQLQPGFEELGWPQKPVAAARRRLAALHATALAENRYSAEERAELVEALRRLGEGWGLRWRLAAIRLGAASVVRLHERARAAARAFVKNRMFIRKSPN